MLFNKKILKTAPPAYGQKIKEVQKARRKLLIIIFLALVAGLFVYPSPFNRGMGFLNSKLKIKDRLGFNLPILSGTPFQLGLDIAGGTSLTYRADLSKIDSAKQSEGMEGLKDIIERRVNLFGVKEPRVEVAKAAGEWRLIVELAGIKDVKQAIQIIGETPILEFKEELSKEAGDATIKRATGNDTKGLTVETLCQPQNLSALMQFIRESGADPCYAPTPLNGRYLSNAEVDFDPTTSQPVVGLQFNNDGTNIFSDLTKRNINKRIAIYLDGLPISTPVVRDAITSGKAQISGSFTIDEAKLLVRRLNEGALPVPINLIEQRTVGAIIGQGALQKSVHAGIVGFALVALFMLLYYRRNGFFAILALLVYTALVLAIFKLIPVTLTLAGIAGFILSIGMAVDANILIFERTKEETRTGKSKVAALTEGFARAWPSIRDSNISTIITSLILYTFTTSIVRGFALTLLLGVLISMFSAIFVTRTFLMSFLGQEIRTNADSAKTK